MSSNRSVMRRAHIECENAINDANHPVQVHHVAHTLIVPEHTGDRTYRTAVSNTFDRNRMVIHQGQRGL